MFVAVVVVAVLVTVHLLLIVDGCCCGSGVGVCVCGSCWLPVVGGADVLMCCDADALQSENF